MSGSGHGSFNGTYTHTLTFPSEKRRDWTAAHHHLYCVDHSFDEAGPSLDAVEKLSIPDFTPFFDDYKTHLTAQHPEINHHFQQEYHKAAAPTSAEPLTVGGKGVSAVAVDAASTDPSVEGEASPLTSMGSETAAPPPQTEAHGSVRDVHEAESTTSSSVDEPLSASEAAAPSTSTDVAVRADAAVPTEDDSGIEKRVHDDNDEADTMVGHVTLHTHLLARSSS
jgi:hypothetical protein